MKFPNICLMTPKGKTEKSKNKVNVLIEIRHLLDPSNPEHLINKKNHKGETPLYVVCKNGYFVVSIYCLSKENLQ